MQVLIARGAAKAVAVRNELKRFTGELSAMSSKCTQLLKQFEEQEQEQEQEQVRAHRTAKESNIAHDRAFQRLQGKAY